MAVAVRMPKMSDTMTEGVIAEWLKKVGDKVKSGDIIAEVETDKATMELENYEEGTLLHIGADKGAAVPIDGIIAIVGEPGEDFSALLKDEAPAAPASAKVEEVVETSAAAPAPAAEAKPAVDLSSIKAVAVRMPKMSDTMTEGVIAGWLKKVGDKVKAGDILAEVETDKATMELDNYEDGTLLYIGAEKGQAVPIDGIIAIIGEEGADYQALLNAEGGSAKPAETAKAEPVAESLNSNSSTNSDSNKPILAVASSPTGGEGASDSRIKASPLAKALAKEKGFDISNITGSGENGRVVKSDIDNFKGGTAPAAKAETKAAPTAMSAPSGVESFEEIGLTQMRKAIARSLADSQTTAVDFSLTMEINMDKSIEARGVMNEASPVKISFNDMVLKACGVALKKHPNVNSSWRGDVIRKNNHVHIGMAVAIPDGLIVPVIRFADTLPLSVLAATTKDLGGKAKSGKLQPADWEGNTFTVSNLGMFGIEQFNSIINNPKNESCILSVGGIKEIVAVKNGTFYATNVMKVTLTCDHRVVDGASGAAFLVTLKELLEQPYKLLV
jgi:pyruvate dehydrogenase E2 component (dihydrolipoamide acetyltransferase)